MESLQPPDLSRVAQANNILGSLMISMRRFDEAEALWRQAIVRSPDFFPALFNLGYMYYSTGRFDQAATWLAKAGRVSPQDFNARYLLGAGRT